MTTSMQKKKKISVYLLSTNLCFVNTNNKSLIV